MVELVPLFEHWINQYVDRPELMRKYFCTSSAAREINRSVYQYFVSSHQLQSIETLPADRKHQLWSKAKTWAELPKEEMIKLSKTIYLIESVCEPKELTTTKN